MEETARSALAAMGIGRTLDPRAAVERLSGGERQAIAICRARYWGARLVILDEPTSALSLRQTEDVLGYVEQARSQGLGIIYITHTLEHVKRIADRIAILYKGSLAAEGPLSSFTDLSCYRLITTGTAVGSTACPTVKDSLPTVDLALL